MTTQKKLEAIREAIETGENLEALAIDVLTFIASEIASHLHSNPEDVDVQYSELEMHCSGADWIEAVDTAVIQYIKQNTLLPENDHTITDDVGDDDDDVSGVKSTSHKPETSKIPDNPNAKVSMYALLIRTGSGAEIVDNATGSSVPDAIERSRLLPGDVVLSCVRM